ncbi:MAG TPA: ROK family protein [Chloroflexota bacterium]|nr:ROK family protein [Chloroflexota bacterium]
MGTRKVLGAVEGGGTKFVCMVGTSPTDVVDEVTIPTTSPMETLGAVVEFLGKPRTGVELESIGVATFGPIDLDPMSPTYGCVLKTTKEEWSGARILAPLSRRLGIPIGWDTDVNGAVLGEARWGAARGVDPVLYLTIGTGIGGGALVNGGTIHGLLHPEMGHLPVPTITGDDFAGICSFHGRCLEGIASGPALAARCGRPVPEVGPDDPVWDLEAHYLAYGISALLLALSPRRIVLGGGVMKQAHLLPRVRRALVEVLNGYIELPELRDGVDEYVVLSELDQKAGLYGALVLAERARSTAKPG